MAKSSWHSFLISLSKAKNPAELSQLLDFFLTHEEKTAIADRYAITQGLLDETQTQRELAQILNVSIAKITRGSNALKTLDAKSKQLLKKLL